MAAQQTPPFGPQSASVAHRTKRPGPAQEAALSQRLPRPRPLLVDEAAGESRPKQQTDAADPAPRQSAGSSH